ncbi:MAG TPA: hypothetical protein DCP90_04870 [Clostridiales bacterium]|nr:MAG: hypothetical protein A2Y22_06395 [Clostridiales bacterium GWD2_32_59]HAN09930.1 hypothetical protein [Clostridiales bacterium]
MTDIEKALSDLMDEMSKGYARNNEIMFEFVEGRSSILNYEKDDSEDAFYAELMENFNKILDFLRAPKELKNQPDIMYERFNIFDFSHKYSSKNIHKNKDGDFVIGRTYKEDDLNPYLHISNIEFEMFVKDNQLVTVQSVKENEDLQKTSVFVDKYKSDEEKGYESSNVRIETCDMGDRDLLTVKNSKFNDVSRCLYIPRISDILTQRELAMRTADSTFKFLTCSDDEFCTEIGRIITEIQQEPAGEEGLAFC